MDIFKILLIEQNYKRLYPTPKINEDKVLDSYLENGYIKQEIIGGKEVNTIETIESNIDDIPDKFQIIIF